MKHNVKLYIVCRIRFLVAIAACVSGLQSSAAASLQSPHEPQQAAGGGIPIRQLNLTPEQREQIRSIRQQTNVERAAINQRVGEANRALETAWIPTIPTKPQSNKR